MATVSKFLVDIHPRTERVRAKLFDKLIHNYTLYDWSIRSLTPIAKLLINSFYGAWIQISLI